MMRRRDARGNCDRNVRSIVRRRVRKEERKKARPPTTMVNAATQYTNPSTEQEGTTIETRRKRKKREETHRHRKWETAVHTIPDGRRHEKKIKKLEYVTLTSRNLYFIKIRLDSISIYSRRVRCSRRWLL